MELDGDDCRVWTGEGLRDRASGRESGGGVARRPRVIVNTGPPSPGCLVPAAVEGRRQPGQRGAFASDPRNRQRRVRVMACQPRAGGGPPLALSDNTTGPKPTDRDWRDGGQGRV